MVVGTKHYSLEDYDSTVYCHRSFLTSYNHELFLRTAFAAQMELTVGLLRTILLTQSKNKMV